MEITCRRRNVICIYSCGYNLLLAERREPRFPGLLLAFRIQPRFKKNNFIFAQSNFIFHPAFHSAPPRETALRSLNYFLPFFSAALLISFDPQFSIISVRVSLRSARYLKMKGCNLLLQDVHALRRYYTRYLRTPRRNREAEIANRRKEGARRREMGWVRFPRGIGTRSDLIKPSAFDYRSAVTWIVTSFLRAERYSPCVNFALVHRSLWSAGLVHV